MLIVTLKSNSSVMPSFSFCLNVFEDGVIMLDIFDYWQARHQKVGEKPLLSVSTFVQVNTSCWKLKFSLCWYYSASYVSYFELCFLVSCNICTYNFLVYHAYYSCIIYTFRVMLRRKKKHFRSLISALLRWISD